VVPACARAAARPALRREGEGLNPAPVPDDLDQQLKMLEGRIGAAIALIGRLRKENEELKARLAEGANGHAEALRRLDSVLDRIDALL
jgi:transposase